MYYPVQQHCATLPARYDLCLSEPSPLWLPQRKLQGRVPSDGFQPHRSYSTFQLYSYSRWMPTSQVIQYSTVIQLQQMASNLTGHTVHFSCTVTADGCQHHRSYSTVQFSCTLTADGCQHHRSNSTVKYSCTVQADGCQHY